MSEPREFAKVLVVDDEPANLKLLRRLFVQQGYPEPALIEDPRQVLAHCRQTPPDLILLDMMMPGVDGVELCDQLKNDPALRDIPVIFVTARDNLEAETRALVAGASDFISKPFEPELLFASVRAHLAQASRRASQAAVDERAEQLAEKLREELRRMQAAGQAQRHLLSGVLRQLAEARLELAAESRQLRAAPAGNLVATSADHLEELAKRLFGLERSVANLIVD